MIILSLLHFHVLSIVFLRFGLLYEEERRVLMNFRFKGGTSLVSEMVSVFPPARLNFFLTDRSIIASLPRTLYWSFSERWKAERGPIGVCFDYDLLL